MLLCINVTLYECYIVTILHPAMQGLHLFCVWPPSVTLPSYQAPLQPSLLDFPNVDHVWAFFHNWPSNEILCSPSLVSKGLSMSKIFSSLGCFFLVLVKHLDSLLFSCRPTVSELFVAVCHCVRQFSLFHCAGGIWEWCLVLQLPQLQ